MRMTTAQALVRWLGAQRSVLLDGTEVPLFPGVFAIFGHGNVTCLGEALEAVQDQLPTWRGQNEQSMALAGVAYAKARKRRQIMVAASSIGPGALNMVTAAGVAHSNRLPILLLSGDPFANRVPDPVLQQVEHFHDPTMTVNDAFKAVTRYWDRIGRPCAAPGGAAGWTRPPLPARAECPNPASPTAAASAPSAASSRPAPRRRSTRASPTATTPSSSRSSARRSARAETERGRSSSSTSTAPPSIRRPWAARRAIGDDGKQQVAIEPLYGRAYRFVREGGGEPAALAGTDTRRVSAPRVSSTARIPHGVRNRTVVVIVSL